MNQGFRLKQLIKKKGITQKELAEKLEINEGYFSTKIKLGEFDDRVMRDMANILDMSVNELEVVLNDQENVSDENSSSYIIELQKKLILAQEDAMNFKKEADKQRGIIRSLEEKLGKLTKK